jgi:hypothetical protein
MQPLRSRLSALVAGLSIGTVFGACGLAPGLQIACATPAPPSRVVVGLKDPVTPAVVAELKRVFQGRILTIAPGGTYALVLLRRGETLAQIQARSRRIAWVEPEIAMGIAKQATADVLLIPAPRIAKGAPK